MKRISNTRPTQRPSDTAERKKLVIVGAGYAGLAAATSASREFETTLINPSPNHVSITELPGYVATGRKVETPLAPLAQKNGFTLLEGLVDAYDPETKRITLTDGSTLNYDALILAAGGQSRTTFAGTSVPQGVWGLRSLDDAKALKAELERRVGEHAASPGSQPVSVSVVGGGMTGIELAAALAERYGTRVNVRLVGRINLPDELGVSYTRDTLTDMGVHLHEDARVQTLRPDGMTVTERGEEKSLDADIVVAAMGDEGAASDLNSEEAANQAKRLVVEPTLQMANHPEVFVAGDAATHVDPKTGTEIRQTAAMAELAGRHAAQNVGRLFAGEDLKAFSGDLRMWLASLGERDAVGSVLGVPVRGLVATTIKNGITTLSEHPSRLGYHIVQLADVMG